MHFGHGTACHQAYLTYRPGCRNTACTPRIATSVLTSHFGTPNGLPEPLGSCSKVIYHSLSELILQPGICLCSFGSCSLSAFLCWIRTPLCQPGLRDLHPQLDSTPVPTSRLLGSVTLTTQVLISVHSNFIFLMSSRIQEKHIWWWGLKSIWAETFKRSSPQTLHSHLGLSGLSSTFPCHLIQVTTRWWSVDNPSLLPSLYQSVQNMWPQVTFLLIFLPLDLLLSHGLPNTQYWEGAQFSSYFL